MYAVCVCIYKVVLTIKHIFRESEESVEHQESKETEWVTLQVMQNIM